MPQPTIAHYNGTLQWHPATTPPKLVVTLPPKPYYDGTLQGHRVHSPKVRGHPIAHYNGTLQWHHAR